MNTHHLSILSCLILLLTMSCKETKDMSFVIPEVFYPTTHADDTINDDYHGTQISDPYRWLEDDNSEDTKAWVRGQNDVTFGFLEAIPFREKVKERLTQLWNYEKYSTPFKEAGVYYFFKNDGLQNQSVLYKLQDDGQEVVVLDPNSFSSDGTTSLAGFDFSKDGRYLAYLKSNAGSDWRTAHILDLKTGEHLTDQLEWIKFSGLSWRDDGFYYSRYPTPKPGEELSAKNEFHTVYYHKIGQDQSKDELIVSNPNYPSRNATAYTTEDNLFLIISESESTSGNMVRVQSLKDSKKTIKTIFDGFGSDNWLITNEGSTLYFLTNKDAPKKKLVSIDFNDIGAGLKTVIPESDNVISSVSVAGNKLYVSRLVNAASHLTAYDFDGKKIADVNLPGIGSIGGVSGKKEDREAFYSFTAYINPATIYSLNTDDQTSSVFKQAKLDFTFDDYTTEQVWYESYDGTRVPMFLTFNKNIKRDGRNPTLLYGYGGFNISMTPGFSPSILPMLENGGIYAVANIRGGGEFGKEWHLAGTKERKQNVFDDFQAAAEYLINNKYTSPQKLAIRGGSNGGLLVGACMTQRPDLFAVAFPAVGVLDMLRYHEFTIGRAWAVDYGRSDNPEDFEYLIKYSPLHNVKPASYPATMITTADHDDRVVPAHSFKYAAELQSKHQGPNPVLIRIETNAGHGAGKPTAMVIEEQADIFSFMYFNMQESMRFPMKD